ncbi:lipopolysaccharide biosynthesis protein [Pseudonocardia sp. 1LY6.1]
MAGALALSQVLVGVMFILAIRRITPTELGSVTTTFAVGTIGATVFDFGLANLLVRELASGRVARSTVLGMVRLKRRFIPLLIAPVAVVGLLLVPDPFPAALLSLVGALLWEAGAMNALLRATEQFTRAATAQVAGRTAGLLVTVLILALGDPTLALAAGLVVGYLGEAIIGRYFLGRSPGGAVSIADGVAMQRRAASFGLVSLSAVGQQLDTPLVTLGGGLTIAGLYSGAGRLLGPLLFLSSALALVGAPWLARAQGDLELLRAEERRVRRFSMVLAVAPLLAASVGPWVMPWILGPAFAASGWVLSVLAIGCTLSTLNQGAATILQNRGYEGTVGRAITIGLTTGLVTTYLFALTGSAAWAAAGFVLSQLYIQLHLAIRLRRPPTQIASPQPPAAITQP